MTNANDRFLQRLDRAVRWTGVPALAERQQAWIDGREPAPHRRHLRWWPMLALALAIGGFAGCVAWGDPRHHAASYSAVMVGYALSLAFPLLGPIKPWGQTADERERAVRRDAFFFAFATISAIAVVGLWGLSAGVLLGGWGPDRTVNVLNAAAFTLFAFYCTLPTLHASWRTRPLAADEEA